MIENTNKYLETLENALQQQGVAHSDIQKAKNYQSKFGGRLELVLVNLGSLSEEALPTIYHQTLGYALLPELDIREEHLVSHLEQFNIQSLAEHRWLALAHDEDKLCFVTDNPLSLDAFQRLSELKQPYVVYLAGRSRIDNLISLLASKQSSDQLLSESFDHLEESKLRELASEAPVVNLFNSILGKALNGGASDIHFEPVKGSYRVRFRVDGVLSEADTIVKGLQLPLISRIKILSGMDIAEKRRPQDGKIETKISGQELDVRVSALPLNEGESVVLRLLRKDSIRYDMDVLGVSDDVMNAMMSDIKKTSGVILITGPTGSGKTTTLYTMLNELNDEKVKIISLEDPVEYQLEGINQVQINSDINFDFAAGLRSIVRQDPDVIMLGEIRDQETATIALQSALTGHLVFSTVHTNDAPSAFTRMIDLGVEEFLLNAAVVSVMAQRLVRKLCHCAQPMSADEEAQAVQRYHINLQDPRYDIQNVNFKKAVGCPHCANTGYRGRMAIIEYLACDATIANLPKNDTFLEQARKHNASKGFRTLFEDGIYKVLRGQTTIEEVARVAG